MEALLAFALFAIFAVAIVSIVELAKRSALKRTQALRAAAETLGWNFRAEVPYETIPNLERFELFGTGRARKLNNLLTSPAGELRAVLFDYSYTTGGGKSQQTHRQTVFYCTSEVLNLPTFSLRPENFFHRFATMLGYQDIDVADRPEFSRLFLLRGEAEAQVLNTFSPAVTEFFERNAGMCSAAKGRELLYWRPGRFARPEELQALIEQGFEAARALAGSATAPHNQLEAER